MTALYLKRAVIGDDIALHTAARKNFYFMLQELAPRAMASIKPDHYSMLQLRGNVFELPTFNIIVESLWQALDDPFYTTLAEDWKIQTGALTGATICYKGIQFATLYELAILFTEVDNLNPDVVNAMDIHEYFKLIQTRCAQNSRGFEAHWLLPERPDTSDTPKDGRRTITPLQDVVPLTLGVVLESIYSQVYKETAKVSSTFMLLEAEQKRLHARDVELTEQYQSVVDEQATLNAQYSELLELNKSEQCAQAKLDTLIRERFANMSDETWQQYKKDEAYKGNPDFAHMIEGKMRFSLPFLISYCVASFLVGVLAHDTMLHVTNAILNFFR